MSSRGPLSGRVSAWQDSESSPGVRWRREGAGPGAKRALRRAAPGPALGALRPPPSALRPAGCWLLAPKTRCPRFRSVTPACHRALPRRIPPTDPIPRPAGHQLQPTPGPELRPSSAHPPFSRDEDALGPRAAGPLPLPEPSPIAVPLDPRLTALTRWRGWATLPHCCRGLCFTRASACPSGCCASPTGCVPRLCTPSNATPSALPTPRHAVPCASSSSMTCA